MGHGLSRMRVINTDFLGGLIVLLLIQVAYRDTPPTNQSTAGGELVAVHKPIVDHHPKDAIVRNVEWTPELEQLRASILGAGCTSPCLFGITPGVTTADEVPAILNPLTEDGVVEDFYLITHPNGLRYGILFPAGGGGSIGILEQMNLVTDISLGFSNRFLTLGDVIGAYGEPDLVAYAPGDSYEGLRFFYIGEQIFLWARTDSFGDQPVSPAMTIISLIYLSPGAVNNPLESPYITWVEWEGYLDIYDYYRKSRPEQYGPAD